MHRTGVLKDKFTFVYSKIILSLYGVEWNAEHNDNVIAITSEKIGE